MISLAIVLLTIAIFAALFEYITLAKTAAALAQVAM